MSNHYHLIAPTVRDSYRTSYANSMGRSPSQRTPRLRTPFVMRTSGRVITPLGK
jgi:hypothetical protein